MKTRGQSGFTLILRQRSSFDRLRTTLSLWFGSAHHLECQSKRSGFTMIELLVVISVIGLLASVILVSLNSARDKAKAAKVAADYHQIQVRIELARDSTSQITLVITGNGCSDCPFRNGVPIKDPSHAADVVDLNTSWSRLGFASTPVDPWGNPYMLDENEREFGVADCRNDHVQSAGPDGIHSNGDDLAPLWVPNFVCF